MNLSNTIYFHNYFVRLILFGTAVIYKSILFTNFKKQLTFVTQLFNYTNAATFKAVALSCGLYAYQNNGSLSNEDG